MHTSPPASDLAPLAAAVSALLTPARERDEAAWALAATRAARDFLAADWARLTVRADGRTRAYADGAPRARGVTLWIEAEVGGPARAATLACRVRVPPGTEAAAHARELLDILQPALAAAARERLGSPPPARRAAEIGADVAEGLDDGIGDATAVYSTEGEVQHESDAFRRAVPPPGGAWVRAELARIAREAGAYPADVALERDVHDAAESYRVSARRVALDDGAAFVLLDLRPLAADAPGDRTPARHPSGGGSLADAAERLRDRFGLTRREVDVARQLLRGASNDEVARDLGISPATARHHTEHVLRKLGARSRAAIADALLAPPGAVTERSPPRRRPAR